MIWNIIIYLAAFSVATYLYLKNINKRADDIGSIIIPAKRTLNKTTIFVCVSVLIVWIVMVVLMLLGKMSLSKDGENDVLMFAVVGLATSTVFVTLITQFTLKTGIYSNGCIISGVIMKYGDISSVKKEKRKVSKTELYDLKFCDAKGVQKGALLCDPEEVEKISTYIKKRNIKVEEI